MVVYSVSVYVKAGHEEDFRRATRINHEQTRTEPGNLRFDVLQSRTDPTRFMLYEVYRSQDAVAAHKATEHYQQWRDTVAPWMARDRHGEQFAPLFPTDEQDW